MGALDASPSGIKTRATRAPNFRNWPYSDPGDVRSYVGSSG
jgi:hypothetical protein